MANKSSFSRIPAAANRPKTSRRQGIRRLTGLVMLLSFPITMNWLSPWLSVWGAWSGVIAGSLFVFGGLFVSGLIFGRGFCGWLCPMGALQDLLRPMQDKRVISGRWAKFAVWGVWFFFLTLGFFRSWGPPVPSVLFGTENGVSVAEPSAYIIYGTVIVLFSAVALAVGRRGACHRICWIDPFLMAGRGVADTLTIPHIRLWSNPLLCSSCGTCRTACPMSLNIPEMARDGKTEHRDCVLCGECVDACPEGTLSFGFGRT